MRSLLVLLTLFCSTAVAAAPLTTEVTVCTQNLNNFPPDNPRKGIKQKFALLERITSAGCDIVALQEVRGNDTKEAAKNLRILTRGLNKGQRRNFVPYVGASNDHRIRNGFLIDKHKFSVKYAKSFAKQPVLSLQPLGPVRHFSRGPFMVFVKLKHASKSTPGLSLSAVHFKSKADGWKDITKTNYEFLRMEMAEAMRKIALAEQTLLPEDTLFFVMGDLNSDADSATAAILSGRMELSDFSGKTPCSLDKELRPLCAAAPRRSQSFVPLVATAAVRQPAVRGTYRYRGVLDTIDEILISAEDVNLVKDSTGALKVGITGVFGEGSDHKLVWSKLALPLPIDPEPPAPTAKP